MYLYFPNGEVNAVLSIYNSSKGYGAILLIGPTLRSTLLHLIGTKYPLLLA